MGKPTPNFVVQTRQLYSLWRTISLRDHILMRLLYETGCTLETLPTIKVHQIKHAKIEFDTHNSAISITLREHISQLCKHQKLKQTDYLFQTRQSDALTPKRAAQIVHHHLACLAGNKTAPDLRRLHILNAAHQGLSPTRIAHQIGIRPGRVFDIISQEMSENQTTPYPLLHE